MDEQGRLDQILDRAAALASCDAAALLLTSGGRAATRGRALVTEGLARGAREQAWPVLLDADASSPATVPTRDSRRGTLGWVAAAGGFAASRTVPLGEDVALVLLTRDGRAPDPGPLESAAELRAELALQGRVARAEIAAAVEGRRRELVGLVARGVLSRLDLDEVFPELIRLVGELGPCDAASIAVYHPDADEFELVSVYPRGGSGPIQRGTMIPARDTAIFAAFGDEADFAIDPDTSRSPFPRGRVLASSGIATALYLPIGVHGARHAVLCVGRGVTNGFSADEVDLFRDLVPFVGLALRNAQVHGQARAAYRELADAQARLIQAERQRALGDLAAGLADEIGNVLATISTQVELIERRGEEGETSRSLAACRAAVERGVRAVQRVIDLVGASCARGPTQERVRLDEVVVQVASEVRRRSERTRRADVVHVFDLSRVRPGLVASASQGETREALEHLVRNAVEAMPRGGTVTISLDVKGDQARVSVEDSGSGVAETIDDRIYEPFFTTKSPSHPGLGLAAVSGLAQRRGGSIRHTARAGGGTRFELFLPLAGGAVPATEPARPSRRVLLVEDEAALGRALAELLRLRGHEVELALDVDAALAAIARRPPDVVVTDLALPGRSGWDLIAETRSRPHPPPVVVLSGWGGLVDDDEARTRGAAAVLAKPVRDDELERVIDAVAEGRAARDDRA